MNIDIEKDLWTYLQITDKPILMYGMGNGADKILAVCEKYGITVSDFFASDGFVRGHFFHGKKVLSYSEAKEKYKDFIVLLSFASSLKDVINNIQKIASEVELYAPDVPVFGDNLFNMEFFNEHRADFEYAYSLFDDERSKEVFKNVIHYKLSGKIDYLFLSDDCEGDVMDSVLNPKEIKRYVDLGAYNGDTIRSLIKYSDGLSEVIAFEPDRRNFRKLSEYKDSTSTPKISIYNIGAWDSKGELCFDSSGNRNANISDSPVGKKAVTVSVDSVDNICLDFAPDYIKYDVEGSEKEALLGSRLTIERHSPRLLVSAYHRSEDLYLLPRLIKELNADYKLYLRKLQYIPAWDLNIYAI